MSDDRNFERTARAWLELGPSDAPDHTVEAALLAIETTPQERTWLLPWRHIVRTPLAIAATGVALVLVAIVGIAVLGSPKSGVGGTTASPTPSAAPSTSGIPLTNPGPLGASLGTDAGKAGTYHTAQFRPTLEFTVPAGWSVGPIVNTSMGADETAVGIPLTDGSGAIIVTTPTSVDPPAPGDPGSPVPADLMAWLKADPDLTLGPVTDVTIAGLPAKQVEGSLSTTARVDTADGGAHRLVDFLPLLPRHQFRIAVVDVGGTQVMVATVANKTDFAAFGPTATTIIDTMRFVGQ